MNSEDDREESLTKPELYPADPTLELGEELEHVGPQIVGLRFTSLPIPRQATITRAFVEFQSDERDSEPASLLFQAEASGNPAPFYSNPSLSNRARTAASVAWSNVPPWNREGEWHQSPGLAPIVQEIVNRPDWYEGGSMLLFVTGSGERTARASECPTGGSPVLHIEYATGDVPTPTATATAPPGDNNLFLPVLARQEEAS